MNFTCQRSYTHRTEYIQGLASFDNWIDVPDDPSAYLVVVALEEWGELPILIEVKQGEDRIAKVRQALIAVPMEPEYVNRELQSMTNFGALEYHVRYFELDPKFGPMLERIEWPLTAYTEVVEKCKLRVYEACKKEE